MSPVPAVALPAFHLHADVMLVVVTLAGLYWWAEARLRPLVAPDAAPASRGQKWAWTWGVATVLVSAGWPVHDIAEESLFSIHMVEHLLLGYVAPMLLLAGMPRWMADRVLGHGLVAPWLRPLARPVPAFFAFNAVLVLVHWPQAVAVQNTSEIGHLGFHALLFGTGVLLWIPVLSPTPALPRISRPMQMLYLVLNTIIPIVPASFLTFSTSPLYPVYGDAASAWGISAVTDQTIAGLIMKLGGGFYLLGVIAWIWFRWIREEREWDSIESRLLSGR